MSYSQSLEHQYAAVPPTEQQYSYTGSTVTQKPDGPSSTLVAAQERASRERVVRRTCLIATGILVCLVGMIFAFLSFICVFHQCQISNHSVISTAPLGQVLTISQVTSHVAPLSLPIIMGLFSYLLSARWLRSSTNGGPDQPSPTQYVQLQMSCPICWFNITQARSVDVDLQWRWTVCPLFIGQIHCQATGRRTENRPTSYCSSIDHYSRIAARCHVPYCCR